jgi:TatA/E family protein of Tat protein translocase
VFGIGPTELLIIGFLALLLFGPGKAAGMARDLGSFIKGAQDTVEDFKSELASEEIKEARHTVEEFKDEARHSVEKLKHEIASGAKEGEKHASHPPLEYETREPKESREPSSEEKGTPPPVVQTQAKKQEQPS